jgi:NADPH:quinone reductase
VRDIGSLIAGGTVPGVVERFMRAVWYERQGPAGEVLQVGELPAPDPGPGEVRVGITRSGVNPGDTKKRRGWLGSAMPFPRVIPHSDGAGVIESVGEGVDPATVGRRVWVFGDGPVAGMTVLVHGVLGGVGALAAQLAHWGGATVVGTVRHGSDLERVNASAVAHAVALDQPEPAGAIRAHAPEGVDRIVEVAFSDNVDLDAAVARNQAVIAAYATRQDRPAFPFWPMLFDNVTIRLLGSDDFPAAAKQQAATGLTAAAREGALSISIGAPLSLEQVAEAHDRVDAGARDRVLLAIPD